MSTAFTQPTGGHSCTEALWRGCRPVGGACRCKEQVGPRKPARAPGDFMFTGWTKEPARPLLCQSFSHLKLVSETVTDAQSS